MSWDVIWLEPNQSLRESLVGGKGAGLLRLANLGFRVPPGFVLTTAAFQRILSPKGHKELLDQIGGISAWADLHEIERVASLVRGILIRESADHPVLQTLAHAYEALGDRIGILQPPVAVRSSAAAEDSEATSFAGEHDTFLWVAGKEDVLIKTRRCWASLYTTRAIAYRRRFSAAVRPAMAVVVQQMVPAESSGVMMTLNPANGDRSKLLIESAWGLGGPLVAGQINPDRFLIDRVTAQVVRTDIADKPFRHVRDEATGRGVGAQRVPPDRQGSPSLTQDEIEALIEIGRRIDASFDVPQVIEFAALEGEVYLLQCRPETNWSRKPARSLGLHHKPVEQVISVLLRGGRKKPP